MLAIPGWALLSLGRAWYQWRGLQRWIVAIGLGIAFYPVLYYTTRALLPGLRFGPHQIGLLLLLMALFAALRLRRHVRSLFTLDGMEWIAVAVFGMTLFTRIWIIRGQPYPAWSDSLHHTLLTQLTAGLGQLPFTLEPYAPVPLAEYHLGLYALTGAAASLARVPAHTALLWTAQLLNGLCGLGVYLVLDRKCGRVGAILGAVVVGLLSHQPAFYVNWGRFTQVASQTILLIAWLVTWEALKGWRQAPGAQSLSAHWWPMSLAAMLNGALYLLHFRVAVFYLPLLLITLAWELWQERSHSARLQLVLGSAVIGALSVAVILPALSAAFAGFATRTAGPAVGGREWVTAEGIQQTSRQYFEYSWNTVPELAARTWLLVLAGLAGVAGLLRRNKLVLASLAWTAALVALANGYRLGVTWLSLTNLGAILIMLYLPIGLVIGATGEQLLGIGPAASRLGWSRGLVAAALACGFVGSHARAADIEGFRYFVTREDIGAMDWIRENTPADSLFAVNTFFWLPYAPHGTDAGYWIPYLTGRQTTAGVMLLTLAGDEYQPWILALARAAEELESNHTAVKSLQSLGVDYVYLGRMGDFSGPGLSADLLSQSSLARLCYHEGGVSIYQIITQGVPLCPGNASSGRPASGESVSGTAAAEVKTGKWAFMGGRSDARLLFRHL
jgi:hypothetical protein